MVEMYCEEGVCVRCTLQDNFCPLGLFTEGTIPDFLHVSADSEEREFIYESMVDEAQNLATVETLLLHYFSQDYFNRTDYLLEKCNSKWALEFELITLVSSQKSKLQHWAEK